MTLVLELSPELEARVRAEAARRGITPEQLVRDIITEALAEYDADDQGEGDNLPERTHAGL